MLGGRIQRGIASQILWASGLITSGLVFLLWIQNSFYFLPLLTTYRIPLSRFLELIVWLLPDLLTVCFPFAFFIAVFGCYYRLMSTNMHTVIANTGANLNFCFKPLLWTGLATMMTMAFLTLYLLPLSLSRFKTIEHAIRTTVTVEALEARQFNRMGAFVVYVDEKIPPYTLKNLMIYDERDPRKITVLTAQHAKANTTQPNLVLTLKNGVREIYQDGKCSFLAFKTYTVSMRDYFDSKRSVTRTYERSLRDLWRQAPHDQNPWCYFFEAYRRLYIPLSVFSFGILAFLIAVFLANHPLPTTLSVGLLCLLGLHLTATFFLRQFSLLGHLAALGGGFVALTPVFALLYKLWRERMFEQRGLKAC